jgi:hypothetical protein
LPKVARVVILAPDLPPSLVVRLDGIERPDLVDGRDRRRPRDARRRGRGGVDTGQGVALYFAIRTLSTIRDGAGALGYNLDHRCTVHGADLPCLG